MGFGILVFVLQNFLKSVPTNRILLQSFPSVNLKHKKSIVHYATTLDLRLNVKRIFCRMNSRIYHSSVKTCLRLSTRLSCLLFVHVNDYDNCMHSETKMYTISLSKIVNANNSQSPYVCRIDS